MTKAIIIGSGESTRHWEELTDGKRYDYWGVLNGAILAGTPCTHYFVLDRNCPAYTWFDEGCAKATQKIITNGHNEIYARNTLPKAKVEPYYNLPGWPSEIDSYTDMRPWETGKLFLVGTVVTAALNYFGYMDDVDTIDLIGCECRIHQRQPNKFYLHFYDSEHMPRSAVDVQVLSLPHHAGARESMVKRIQRDRPGMKINYLWDQLEV